MVTATRPADSNTVVFEGHGTAFINNTLRSFSPELIGPEFTNFGGMLVVGGDTVALLATTYTTSSNTVTMMLWGCRVAGNVVAADDIDFLAIGARSRDRSRIAGIDNHVTIELHGVSKQIDVMAVDSSPADPSGSNTVTVLP